MCARVSRFWTPRPNQRIVVCVVNVYHVWMVPYSIASWLVLVWTTLFIYISIVAPVVAARRITIIPCIHRLIGKTLVPTKHLLSVVYEIVVVKLVVRRQDDVDTARALHQIGCASDYCRQRSAKEPTHRGCPKSRNLSKHVPFCMVHMTCCMTYSFCG